MAKEAISRYYEGSEVGLLTKTRSKIFLLLGFLMGGQYLKGFLGLIGFGICIGNTDIQNIISAMGPETMDKKITSVITRSGQWGRRGRRSRRCRRNYRASRTGMNECLSWAALGVKAQHARSASSSCSSLWQARP